LYEFEFAFDNIETIGYSLDFGEIKRIAFDFVDTFFDHGAVLNPKDEIFIDACNKTYSKYWLMSLNGKDIYCNPSAENISKELFILIDYLFKQLPTKNNFWLNKITLYETPNCYTVCTKDSISIQEWSYVLSINQEALETFSKDKELIEYDCRKVE